MFNTIQFQNYVTPFGGGGLGGSSDATHCAVRFARRRGSVWPRGRHGSRSRAAAAEGGAAE
eukprot:12925084-Prorocentrum_lima.AAC.1